MSPLTPSSPAGPATAAEVAELPLPPRVGLPRPLQVLRFTQRQHALMLRARRELGEVFRTRGVVPGDQAVTSHPDHVRSLFTAKPEHALSLTAESSVRPIVGPGSVLTANGARHLRQRKLLLPPFHGAAIERYTVMIAEVTEREIATWPTRAPLALAPRMQAITLDVIMTGIFGVDGRPAPGTPEHALREATRELIALSLTPLARLAQLLQVGRQEPFGLLRRALEAIDEPTYAIVAARRRTGEEDRDDILSLLLRAETEEGERLSDREIRDELLTLVLAGHETTANQLAWTWERLVRNPEALGALTAAVRGESGDGADGAAQVDAVLTESMRVRPVIPTVGRRVTVPWRLGDYCVPAHTPVGISVLLVHHREDLYPEPFAFRPERWARRKPGTYEWLPFGGGTRRCLGAALAMAEMRTVLRMTAERFDLGAADPAPERAAQRNVTMIPVEGGRVVVRGRAG